MNPVIEIARKLEAAIPVQWDRFTKTDDGFYVVYGWIARSDGQRDFLLFEMWLNDPDSFFHTTSSAKYSRKILEVLYGTAEGHNDCLKIDQLYQSESTFIMGESEEV